MQMRRQPGPRHGPSSLPLWHCVCEWGWGCVCVSQWGLTYYTGERGLTLIVCGCARKGRRSIPFQFSSVKRLIENVSSMRLFSMFQMKFQFTSCIVRLNWNWRQPNPGIQSKIIMEIHSTNNKTTFLWNEFMNNLKYVWLSGYCCSCPSSPDLTMRCTIH